MGAPRKIRVDKQPPTDVQQDVFYPKADCHLSPERLAEFRALSNEALGLTKDAIATAVAEATGDRPRRVEAMAEQGTFHRVFSVRGDGPSERICKVATGMVAGAATTLRLEKDVTDLIRHHGVSAPQILAVDTSLRRLPFAFLVAERAAGVSMRSFDSDDDRTEALVAQLVVRLSDLHRIRASGFGLLATEQAAGAGTFPRGAHDTWSGYLRTRLDEHVSVCIAMGAIDRKEGDAILAWFDRMESSLAAVEPVLLHGDPGGHNVFVQEGEVGAIIDWEDALAGDPLYDLAFLATFHPQRRMAGILAACRRSIGNPDFGLFWLYFLRVALAKTVHRYRFGYIDGAGREPGHQRIRRGLDGLLRGH